MRFPVLDKFMGIRLGVDLSGVSAGRTVVVESERRLRRETGYGYVRALWWLRLVDGRSVVSVPPGTADAVRGQFAHVGHDDIDLDEAAVARIRPVIDEALKSRGLPPTNKIQRGASPIGSGQLACNSALLQRHESGDCRRLTDDSVPAAAGIELQKHHFSGGIAYGVVVDGTVVSVATSIGCGVMEDAIAHIGVDTAPDWRRRGYAKTAVAHVVAHVTDKGGEAYYGCFPGNTASMATARSVGFVPYAVGGVIIRAPAADL